MSALRLLRDRDSRGTPSGTHGHDEPDQAAAAAEPERLRDDPVAPADEPATEPAHLVACAAAATAASDVVAAALGLSMRWYGWIGVLLLVLGQLLTLVHVRPLSDLWYGICFTGVILAGDAWVERRSGRGLIRDRPRDLVLMAVLSASAWWGLELANLFFQLWEYSESPDIPMWRQRVRSTWFFATLVPATWVTGMVALSLWPTRGRRRVALVFALGSMVMGVIGEAWNYPASPKWTYDVPLIDFWYVFEMPVLGFLGYGLLALVILASYRFVRTMVLGSATPDGDDPLSLTGL